MELEKNENPLLLVKPLRYMVFLSKYELYSAMNGGEGEEVIHAQGRVKLNKKSEIQTRGIS